MMLKNRIWKPGIQEFLKKLFAELPGFLASRFLSYV
jgi:hypothetical protein